MSPGLASQFWSENPYQHSGADFIWLMTLSPASGDGVEITTDQEQGRCYYCLMCVCGWFMTSSGHLVQTLYCIKWAQAIIHGKAQLCLETRLQSQSLRSPSPQDDIITTTLRVQAWWRMTGHCVLACPGIIVWIRLRSINFKGSRALAPLWDAKNFNLTPYSDGVWFVERQTDIKTLWWGSRVW